MVNKKARGRPKLPPDVRRDRPLQIWITPREERLLKEQAGIDKVSLRDLLMAGPLFRERAEKEDLVPIEEYLRKDAEVHAGYERIIEGMRENAELERGNADTRRKHLEQDLARVETQIEALKAENARLQRQAETFAAANLKLQKELREGKRTWKRTETRSPKAQRARAH